MMRIRGAIGIGLTWAVAWGGAGAVIVLGFLLVTGSRPDPPFPLMLGAFGFVAGVIFSGAVALVERHRRFDQLSLPRFAAWGGAVGFFLSATFVLTVAVGDPSFVRYLAVLGPVFAAAAAGCAAGSLLLARRTERWRSLIGQLNADNPTNA